LDLTSLPEFRKWQSERDKSEATMRQQMQALQARSQELEQQQYQIATAGMDDNEKAAYENRVLRQQMGQMQQQMEAARMQGELGSWMQQVLTTGRLSQDEAPSPTEYASPWAWAVAVQDKAVKKAEKEAEARMRAKQKEERREATTVDTGASIPTGGEKERLQEQLNKLKGTGRTVEAMDLRKKIAALR
jgi:hypothetical protein